MTARLHIGLTGGIACGKSTLAEGLRARGWHVIDTDKIAHQVLAAGTETWKIVVDEFGPSVLQPDQSIDRKVLGRLVFADPQLRAKLNEITHPAIRSLWQREREERARTHPTQPLAVMIPLLYECALEQAFPAVWCVGASRRVQIRRMRARGLSEQEVNQRLQSQMPVADKMARAHLAFWGEGTPATLLAQLDHVRFA
ncbi:MAG TPA: dephospho-CoA kinase [Candidatus Methylacidiphilales bacterium]|nr:dephospho-CoA kinase [Candidatus Methylacidiphilales bacterium]